MVYQRSLAIEFGLQGLEFKRELEMDLLYKNEHVGTRRVDFFVEGLVMVEIKAIEKLEGAHKAQAINYCEAYNIAVRQHAKRHPNNNETKDLKVTE